MRRLFTYLILLIIIVGGIAAYGASQIGTIAKDQIEVQGSAATKTAVTVDGVDLTGLLGGAVALNGLDVANPDGFSDGAAISLGGLALRVDPASVLGDGPIVINEVVLSSPTLAFEHNGRTSNLQTIQKNASGDGAAAGDGEARKVVIKRLRIEDGAISITHPALQGRALAAKLPPITLSDIGTGSDGATTGEVTAQVVEAVVAKAIPAAVETLTKEGIGGLGGLGDIAKDPGGVLDRVFGR